MNLNDLQQAVWAQTDTTSVDLSPQTIEGYLDDAFIHTIAAENRWPFYEQGWQLVQAVGVPWLDMPVDMNPPAIMSVMSVTGGPKLQQINQEEAEDRFTTRSASGGSPTYYSLWANKVWLWPMSIQTLPVEFIVRGYRKPLTTFDALSGQVDADPRLHRALAHYATALAYAQQEDDVLEGRYMERWATVVEMVRKALMDPAGNRPLVMHGNFPRRRGAPNSVVGASGVTGGVTIAP
jgi:hypothetical protein